MDDSFGDSAKEFMHHNSLVLFWDTIKRFLDDVAAEGIHAQTKSVAPDSIGNRNDLLGSSVLKAALHEEISEPVHHKRIGLAHDRFNDFVFLLRSPDFKLLL